MAYSLKVSITSSTGEDVFNLDLTVTGGLSAEEGASLFSSMGNVLGSCLLPGKTGAARQDGEDLFRPATRGDTSFHSSNFNWSPSPFSGGGKGEKRLHTSAKVVPITF